MSGINSAVSLHMTSLKSGLNKNNLWPEMTQMFLNHKCFNIKILLITHHIKLKCCAMNIVLIHTGKESHEESKLGECYVVHVIMK